MYHRKMVAGIMIVFHTMGFAGHSCRGRSTFLWTSYHYLQCESWCDYTTTDLYNWSTISHRILPNTRAILLIFFNNVHTTNSQRLRSLWLPVCVCCNFPRRFGRGKKKKKKIFLRLYYMCFNASGLVSRKNTFMRTSKFILCRAEISPGRFGRRQIFLKRQIFKWQLTLELANKPRRWKHVANHY